MIERVTPLALEEKRLEYERKKKAFQIKLMKKKARKEETGWLLKKLYIELNWELMTHGSIEKFFKRLEIYFL